jgi:hypothetical protein
MIGVRLDVRDGSCDIKMTNIASHPGKTITSFRKWQFRHRFRLLSESFMEGMRFRTARSRIGTSRGGILFSLTSGSRQRAKSMMEEVLKLAKSNDENFDAAPRSTFNRKRKTLFLSEHIHLHSRLM